MKPLRVCRVCGLQANSEDELQLFSKANVGYANLCRRCASEYGKSRYHEIRDRAITFRGKQSVLPLPVRSGVCHLCGSLAQAGKQHHLHHTHPDEDSPCSGIIELCASCHSKIHFRMRTAANSWLRKCIRCGLEARTVEELPLFRADRRGAYGRQNLCCKCNNSGLSRFTSPLPISSIL